MKKLKIDVIEIREGVIANSKLEKAYTRLQKLIDALNKKVVSDETMNTINADIKLINSFSGSDDDLRKVLKKKYSSILGLVQRNQKFVPKNYYLYRWIGFGMLAGVVFSTSIYRTEMSAMGMSISIGMIVGVVIGNMLDNQAQKKGLQLELNI